MINMSQHMSRYKKNDIPDQIAYRSYDDALVECASSQTNEHADIFHEDLIWSSSSLLEARRQFENDVIYLSEALLKTYPTKMLTKGVVRSLCKNMNIDSCLTQMSLSSSNDIDDKELMIYDRQTDKFIAWNNDGVHFASMMKCRCFDVENDVAGRVAYSLATIPSSINDSIDLFSHSSHDLILCGDRFGYDFMAQDTYIKGNVLKCFIIFESKMQEVQIEVEDDLYHIAPLSLKDKILKFGLAPKSKTFMSGEKVNHSDRVYLFNGYDKDVIKRFMYAIQKLSSHYDKLKNELQHKKDYALLKIDRKKIQSLKLYRDNNFMSRDSHHPTAIYTYSNIPPSAISFANIIHVD